jgi:uncharacterized MAPEG superfamily protein
VKYVQEQLTEAPEAQEAQEAQEEEEEAMILFAAAEIIIRLQTEQADNLYARERR